MQKKSAEIPTILNMPLITLAVNNGEIPTQLSGNFELKNVIYNNSFMRSSIRIACSGDNCDFIAKVLNHGNMPIYNKPFTFKDVAVNELVITKKMSEIGIGPKVYDIAMSETQGVIIMEKYDGTLTDLLHKYQKDKTVPVDQAIEKVRNLLGIMHENGIVHRDLSTSNILYKTDGSIALADFGFSVFSTDESLRFGDREYLRGILETLDRIRKGEHFSRFHIMEASLRFPPIATVLFNGVETSDWL